MPKTVFILGHANDRPGSIGVLMEYLHGRSYPTKVLLHPYDDYQSRDTTYNNSGQVATYPRRPGPLNLLGDFWLSLKVLHGADFDIFIGTTNFDTIPAVISRKLLRRNLPFILYYPRDYREDRYRNPVLNQLYYFIESVAVKNADATVSNTKRGEAKRIAHGLDPGRSIVIPNPVKMQRPQFKRKTIRKNHFLYQGDVSREHGLYDLIQTLRPLIKKLVIIGNGPAWDETLELARSLDIELETHRAKTPAFVSDYLEDFDGIGLAPYTLASKWTYYASPLKVSDYVTAGVPVLMSNVPEVATEIERDGHGIVYEDLDLASIKAKLDNFDTSNFNDKARAFYAQNNIQARLGSLPL